jgi:hypothetical protein
MKTIFGSRIDQSLARLSILLMTAALTAGMVGCDGFAPGPFSCGPPSQNLEIQTWYDLDAVRHNLAGHHTLMNDLNSTTAGYEELASPTASGGKGWEPIGFFYEAPFRGSLDGGEYQIRDLFINRPDQDNAVGLFGCVYETGVIKDIGVVNFTVAGCVWVGALVGENDGFVVNCYCTMGNVTGDWDVGGLVGYKFRGTVSNSYYNYDEVLINGQHVITVGALFDEGFEEWLTNDRFLDVNEKLSQERAYYVVNDVTDFKELLAFGQDDTLRFRLANDLDLAGEPNFYIPYLAGEFDGNGHKISNLSFNFSFVSQVGLFGQLASDGTVHDMAAENINITARRRVGGLVGWNEGAVSNSCSTGSVTGEDSIGGLVGSNGDYGAVRNSYSTGNVTGKEAVGGLVGINGKGSTVSNSYSTGSVTCAGNVCLEVGGLVGTGSGIVSNSFWDTETSGQAASDGGTGKTTAEMHDVATFSEAGWNIIAVANVDTRNPQYIWNIVNGATYPFLSWQP